MKTLHAFTQFVVLLSLPLLLGGCGEKEAKPDNPNLKYEIKGDAATITGCDKKASGALIIPATIEGKPVTSIGDKAFRYCSNLTSIDIPSSVTSIGDKAFANCSGLKSIMISDSVTSIGVRAFGGCKSLTGITIGEGVTSIGKEAFSWCSRLTSMTIPESVTSIGEATFYNCSSLTSITIGNSVTSIGERAFYGNSLTSITIPESVTSIGDHAFHGCTGLTSITIGEGATSIEDGAFVDCKNLTAVTFFGDAPKEGLEIFEKSSPTIYRKPEAKGWGDTWGGRPVKLIREKP